MKNKKNWDNKIKNLIKGIIVQSLSIIISALFCINANIFLGNLGHLKTLIKLADEARLNNEYSESITWYTKIANKDSNYAPYAHLAMAEIYSLELANKNYDKAYEEYKYAINDTQDIQIFNSAMNFIFNQISLKNSGSINLAIDFYNDENIDFVVNVMNRINEMDSKKFSSLPINFPIDKENVKYYLSPDTKFEIKQYQWEYVSTITDTSSTLAYTNDTYKVMLVDWTLEPIDDFSFGTVMIYKYYKYKKVEKGSYEIDSLVAIHNRFEVQKPIQLRELNF